jgi:hypothetical protein
MAGKNTEMRENFVWVLPGHPSTIADEKEGKENTH